MDQEGEDKARNWLMMISPDSKILKTWGAYPMSSILGKEGIEIYEIGHK